MGRQQLVEGIDRHELQARRREDLFSRNSFERFFHHLDVSGVAIVAHLAGKLLLGVEQGEIDTPGVDTYRRNVRIAGGSLTQPLENFLPQTEDVPEKAVLDAYGIVCEAMHLL